MDLPAPPSRLKKPIPKLALAGIVLVAVLATIVVANLTSSGGQADSSYIPATYCDGLARFQGTLDGMNNGMLLNSEVLSQLASEQNEIQGASTIAGSSQQAKVAAVATAIDHLKVGLDSALIRYIRMFPGPALQELHAAVAALPAC